MSNVFNGIGSSDDTSAASGAPLDAVRTRVIAALQERLQSPGAPVLRDAVLPERIPVSGLIVLRDGNPGTPEVTLSPLRYHYQHRVEIELVVQAGSSPVPTLDSLVAAIGAALASDRTLGGLCEWVEAEAPVLLDLAVEGAAALRAVTISVALHYSTEDPLL